MRRWQPSEVAFLREASALRLTKYQTAALLDRTPDAVGSKRRELGIRFPPIIKPPSPPLIPLAAIQAETALRFRVAPEKLAQPINRGLGKNGRNSREISDARRVAMYLARTLTNHSLSRIGFYFGGRDHSTVHTGIRCVEKRIEKDVFLAAKIKNARTRLLLVDNHVPALVSRKLEAA